MNHPQKKIPLLFLFCLLCAGLFPIKGKAQCTGGDLSFASNPSMDTTYACLDGNPDMVDFDSSGTTGTNYAFLITDVEDTILAVKPSSDMHDFEPAYPGECHVFGLAYEGTLNANPGDHVSSASATICSDLSSDTLFALRDTLVGDTVWSGSGEDTAYACLDGNSDVINFMNGSTTMTKNYQYVVTGPNDSILGLPPSNMQDFEVAPPGECHVHGIAYLGELNASQGMAVGNVTATECMDLSDQYLTVLRDTLVGDTVRSSSGADTTFACLDNNADVVNFMNGSPTMDKNYQYVVTGPNDSILGLPPSNMQDFEVAPPGECHVHGIAYLGELMASPGMHISNATASKCMDLSDQYLTVLRDTMDAGNVWTTNGNDSVTVMIDGQPDTVWFMNDGASMDANVQYIITDATDTILGLPGSNYQNFEPAGSGECHVHAVAYLGELMASPGMHVSNISASECHDRSDQYITVIRESSSSLEAESAPFQRFAVRPNPVKDQLRVELSSKVNSEASIRIFDHTGRMVEQERRELRRGMNTYRLELASLAKGSYVLRIESEEAVDTRKLIVN